MKTKLFLRATNRGIVLALLCSAFIGRNESVNRVRMAGNFSSSWDRAHTFHGMRGIRDTESGGAMLESPLPHRQSEESNSAPQAESFSSRQRYLMSCVPASAAVAGKLATGKPLTERQMRDAIAPDHNWNRFGTAVANAADALQSVGVNASVITHGQIYAALAKGPVIVVVPSGKVATHAVVCTGRDAGGHLTIWNPDPPRGYSCDMKMTGDSILKDYPAVSVPKSRSQESEPAASRWAF